jgi:hypothetical protein
MPSSRNGAGLVKFMVLILTLALLALLAPVASGQPGSAGLPLRLIGHAINMGTAPLPVPGTPGLRTAPGISLVEITITRWSTPEERASLAAALAGKGQEGLLDALQKTPSVGTIRTPDQLGWDLHYAHQDPTADGGRRILFATNRRISFWEAVNRPNSVNYPFTLGEVHLDPRGHGEGKLSLASRIRVSPKGGFIELEDYATQPVHLEDVRVEAAK